MKCQMFLTKIQQVFFFLRVNHLQECEGSLKHKTELITKLEAKTMSMSDTIEKLDTK